MFRYSYNYSTNDANNVITLSPTRATYAKAFAPALVVWGILGVLTMIASRVEETSLDEHFDSAPTE